MPEPVAPRRSAQPRAPWWRRALRYFLWRILPPLAGIFALSLFFGAILPVPSTLMIGRWLTGQGVDRYWVLLDQVSPELRRAVVAAEDQRYCQHWGVDMGALFEQLSRQDGPARGASTVSMQVAKNLYLWPGRSYLRKVLEMPLAFALDRAWGKRRVMEVYLNIAEWGEGLFGVEAAARHYFSKPAAELDATEAARLVAALPNPFLREAGQRSAHSRRVRERMAGIDHLAGCVFQAEAGP